MASKQRVNTQHSERSDCSLSIKCVTEGQEEEFNLKQQLRFRLQCLQEELDRAKQREQKLRTSNLQLASMIASSAQTAPKRAAEFVAQVEECINSKTAKEKLPASQQLASALYRRQPTHKHTPTTTHSTLSSLPDPDHNHNASLTLRLTKADIRNRMSQVLRMERQLRQ